MRRQFLALAFLAIALSTLASCTQTSPADFANRFIEAENKAWKTGDVNDLKALESDDVIYHLPGMDLKGWKAHEDYIQQGRAMVSDLKQNWKYLSGEGNLFVLSYEASGVTRANATTPASAISANYLCAFRTSDGKIAEVWMNGGTATSLPN
jgi:ketosteroid isomerase-like protein